MTSRHSPDQGPWAQLGPVRWSVEETCRCGSCHSRTGFGTDAAAEARAPPSVLQESAPGWSRVGGGGCADSAPRPRPSSGLARAVGSRGKSRPWECPPIKKNLQAYKITFVWNVGVLKSSSVCFSPLVWLSSAEAAGGIQKKCEQRPSGIPKLQRN